MKVAVTAQGQQVDSLVDPRFGRARYFVVFDTETDACTAVDNAQMLNAAQGAGIQAGVTVVELQVAAVITGNVGPKAFKTLRAGGVDVYTGALGTVADAIAQLKSGKLHLADEANAEPHWV